MMAQKHRIEEAFAKAKEKLFGKSKAQLEKDEAERTEARNTAAQGLVDAAEKGNVWKVRYWLSQGAGINEKEPYNMVHATALIAAAQNGHIGICRLLLEKGAKLNAVDAADIDALTYAAKKGHIRICLLLIQNGARPAILEKEWKEIPPVIHQFPQYQERNPISQKQLDALVAMQKSIGRETFDVFLENFDICIGK
jgi:hypothetical protein